MKRTAYPSDLTDAQWNCILPLIPAARSGGRPRSVEMREIFNAICYVVRSGCAWRMIPIVLVHEASIQDRDGAKLVLAHFLKGFCRLKLIWADGGYRGKLVEWTRKNLRRTLEMVKRNDDVKGFEVLPKRWIVERTFAWLGR